MKKSVFLAIVLLVFSFQLEGKENDSLEIAKNQALLRDYLERDKKDSVIYLSKYLYKKGLENGNRQLQGEALFFEAYVTPSVDSSIALYKEALTFFESEKNWLFFSNRNIATHYEGKGFFLLAIQHYQKALELAKLLEDPYWITMTYADISICYSSAEKYEEGVLYGKKGLSYYEKHLLPEGEDLSVLSILLNAIGINYDLDNRYSAALEYHLRNFELNDTENSNFSLKTICNNLGNTYSKMGDWDAAAIYFEKSYKMRSDDAYTQSTINLNLGRLALHNNRLGDAKRFFQEALYYAQQSNNYEKIRDAYEGMSQYLERANEPLEALRYARLYQSLRDSLLNESKLRSMAEMEALFQIKEQEALNLRLVNKSTHQDMQIQRQQNHLIAAFSGIGLLAMAIGLLWLRVRFRQKIAEAEVQKTLERTRFSAILETEDRERVRIARELHDGLGQVLSSAKLNVSALEESVPDEDLPIFNNALGLLDQSLQEVREISHNMMPATLNRLGLFSAIRDLTQKINTSNGKVTITFIQKHHPEGWPPENVAHSLYRIIQELVKNTLQHADASTITISYYHEKATHFFEIQDNGKGFDTALLETSTGLGWTNIQTRLQAIGGSLTIKSHPGKGSFTQLSVPEAPQ